MLDRGRAASHILLVLIMKSLKKLQRMFFINQLQNLPIFTSIQWNNFLWYWLSWTKNGKIRIHISMPRILLNTTLLLFYSVLCSCICRCSNSIYLVLIQFLFQVKSTKKFYSIHFMAFIQDFLSKLFWLFSILTWLSLYLRAASFCINHNNWLFTYYLA